MPISLAKKKPAPAPKNTGGGGSPDKPGAPLGLVAAFLAAGAFVAEMYVPADYRSLSFQVVAGLAGLMGAFGALGAIKGLRTGPKGAAAFQLLMSIGALGAVAYGFTRPPAPAPVPEPGRPGPGPAPAVTSTDTNAPLSTNAVTSIQTPTPATTNVITEENLSPPVTVQRLLPVTTKTTLLRARTGKLPEPEPEPKPESPKPEVANVADTNSQPAPPEPTPNTAPAPTAPVVDPQFPELAALAPSINLPPPPGAAPAARRYPNTFRGATLATFEEINLAAQNFAAVNNLDIADILDVSGMKTAQVIANRYRQLGHWNQRQTKFKSTIERADTIYEQRLRQAKTSEDRLMTTLAKFRETREQLYTDTLAQTTAVSRVHAAAAGVLKVLGDNFGAWEFDAEEKKLLFDEQEIAAQYQAAIAKVKQASAQVPGS